MPKLSIVIPAFTIDTDLEEMALRAIKSYRYYADELIFSEDGGKFSPQIMSLVDSYLYTHKNGGFTKNVNRGWKLSSGDFTAIVSSDTYLLEGNVKDLCIPDKVTSPEVRNQEIPYLAGPFFVVPKEIREKNGLLLEEMHTYCSDSEYDHRVRGIFQKVPSVIIWHDQARTVKQAGVEGGKQQEQDRHQYEQLIDEGKAAW